MKRAERHVFTSSSKASRSVSRCCMCLMILPGVATWKAVHRGDLLPVITAISFGDNGMEHVAA
eukprot:9414261-Karenia_brevis.AAC.1